ncbi:MAG TPA: hypothetical protein PLF42_15770 [Anaerolineales bacterium]|nr:hypothetical protein [Anaerolineales bacterium]
MKTKTALWIALLFFLLSCAFFGTNPASPSAPQPAQTQEGLILPPATPACIFEEPTQRDIDRALDFTGGLFAGGDWERSHFAADGRVGVTWLNNSIGAVSYLEALIFPCGYEEADLDAYFSSANWDIIFENYQWHEVEAECSARNGLRLYEAYAASDGFDYDIRYWVFNDTDNRVITMMMTFPESAEDLLDDYAASLFPNLPHCP